MDFLGGRLPWSLITLIASHGYVTRDHLKHNSPAVDANNFELKPALIFIVQQSQFGGTPWEGPNLHLSVFLEECHTLKLNGVSNDAIRLCLFPFSLSDKARAWLHSLLSGCITIWDELTRAFLTKFFPPGKTVSLRNQIINFLQK